MPKVNLFDKPIKSVAIVYRTDTKPALKMAQQLAKWLSARKIKVYSHPQQKISPSVKRFTKQSLDMVVVLGGDGTYLQAVRMLDGTRAPILGVNMGSLGFLTINRADDLYNMMESALAGELEIKARSLIRLKIRQNKKTTKEFTALNDLVIERGPSSHLIHIGISIDRVQINALKADGLIVATPTGSTAYNLAAGGPILHPEVNALVATPICPHALTSRPFIFPDNRKITFRLLSEKSKGMLTVDGSKVSDLSDKDEVIVERHNVDHFILRRVNQNFFSLLRDKLKFGERA